MFNYTTFKSIMDISDISEETYAFILRSVFQYVSKVHTIDVTGPMTEDLQYAIFMHAKYIYESQVKNTALIASAKDPSGGSVIYNTRLPAIIESTYKMYSPNDPVIL